MNLLANQLTLSSVELRNGRRQEALVRLKDTQQAYQSNAIVVNNLSVVNYLKNTHTNQQSSSQISVQHQINPKLLQSFTQSIKLNPTSYIPYYNLFNFYARQNQLFLALPPLIQSISALYLQKALKQKSQKILNQVQRQYCCQSVVVYLIKALVHIRNQKYVIAVSDLFWVAQKVKSIRDQIQILYLIQIIFFALGEKQKQLATEEDIKELSKKLPENFDKKKDKQQSFRLISAYQIPQNQQDLKTQISKKLREFAGLIKQKQVKSLKSSSTFSEALFKQINFKDLSNKQSTKSVLLQQIKRSIEQSPLYTKSQSKNLSSRKSVQLSLNESQQFFGGNGSGGQRKVSAKQNSRGQDQNTLSMTTGTPKKVGNQRAENPMDQSDSRKLNNSLNTSGLRGKKRTQNIYPLQRQSQTVEIKLVMAQLTNNKQLLGNMDPYCTIFYNGQKKQSTVIKGGGLQPRWKQSFLFNLTHQPSQVILQVYDKESYFKKDDFVGSGKLIVQNNGFTKVKIFEAQKEAGTVFVSIQAKV